MQAASRAPGQQAPVKIYNAVYSSVQVYECMVRGIAVMRRRADSYVNATQILKVAGVDKGRRTKILEKEILPGKHEIVQGGYGKYQGTWIPLERGRDIATQYGVAPLLAPLFDFVPNTNAIGALPPGMPSMAAAGHFAPGGLAPPPIMPGSALRLLNQGRAQGLFTPSTSTLIANPRPPGYASPGPYYPGHYPNSPFPPPSTVSPTPPPTQPPLKRTRSDTESEISMGSSKQHPSTLAASPDIQMADRSRPPSTAPQDQDGPPNKRVRMEVVVPQYKNPVPQPPQEADSRPIAEALRFREQLPYDQLPEVNGKRDPTTELEDLEVRFATKPFVTVSFDLSAPARDPRCIEIVNNICQVGDPRFFFGAIHHVLPINPGKRPDIDNILDEQGHTALHIAASMARTELVEELSDPVHKRADVRRGNYNGETALMRAVLTTNNYDAQTFDVMVRCLHKSIRTIDTSRKSVVHHIVATAGIKGRAQAARYYLEKIFYWIAQHQGGDFKGLVDLQDENGDTALNIAARVGNRSLVRMLLDVGANRILPNKLGLRPGDFGVETEELGGGPRADDLLSSLRAGPSAPVQRSQDVLADIETLIQGLSVDFQAEIKSKQDGLDLTQAHLRAATRELSDVRKQIQSYQSQCAELDVVQQRVRNMEKALEDEDRFDWTGRTDPGSTSDAGPAFRFRGPGSTMAGIGGTVDLSFNLDSEPAVPASDSIASLIRLRRLNLWHMRMEKLMEERLSRLQGADAEKEFLCKKIVALCTATPMEKVDEVLDDLVIAVESESQVMDIGRISGFMQKVRNGAM